MVNINDKIDLWHTGPYAESLHEFLGMTWEEYQKFVHTGEIPEGLKDVYYEA